MTRFFNRTTEKERRHKLRKNMTDAENVVWSKLRAKQMCGQKFRRQYSVGVYVLDFYCPALKLAIEIDGGTHFQAGAKISDVSRQEFIARFGIHFLRFTNRQVNKNLEGVLAHIKETVEQMERTEFNPPPPYEAGRRFYL